MKDLVLLILSFITAISVFLSHPVFAQDNCNPAYPDVCIAPAPPDVDCGDIEHRNFTVLDPDPHRCKAWLKGSVTDEGSLGMLRMQQAFFFFPDHHVIRAAPYYLNPPI